MSVMSVQQNKKTYNWQDQRWIFQKKNIFPYVLIILINGEGQKFTLGEKGSDKGKLTMKLTSRSKRQNSSINHRNRANSCYHCRLWDFSKDSERNML